MNVAKTKITDIRGAASAIGDEHFRRMLLQAGVENPRATATAILAGAGEKKWPPGLGVNDEAPTVLLNLETRLLEGETKTAEIGEWEGADGGRKTCREIRRWIPGGLELVVQNTVPARAKS